MSLTKVSFSMISGTPVNVVDYGADPTGATDSAAAINAALAASNNVYIPAGVYLISTALLPKTNQSITGVSATQSVLKATTVGMTVISYPSGTYSNVRLNNFSINGDSKAAKGINFISQGQGYTSNCYFENLNVGDCTVYGVYISQLTYGTVVNCSLSGGSYALFLNECYSSAVYNSILYDSSVAPLIVSKGTQIYFEQVNLFTNPTVATSALCIIDGAYALNFNNCQFEPLDSTTPTISVILKNTFAGLNSCSDNTFTNCRFIGVAATQTYAVTVGSGGVAGVYKTTLVGCGFITPSSGYSILLDNQQYTAFVRCYDLVSYGTETYAPITVNNVGGNAYYQENVPGAFPISVNSPIILATNYVATGTVSTKWISGSGSPEGAVAADVGCLYSRTDGSTSTTLYVKTSGTGNTGWTAK